MLSVSVNLKLQWPLQVYRVPPGCEMSECADIPQIDAPRSAYL